MLVDEKAYGLTDNPELEAISQEAVAYQQRVVTAARKMRRLIFEDNRPFVDFVEASAQMTTGDVIATLAHLPNTPSVVGMITLAWLYTKYFRQRPLGVPKSKSKKERLTEDS
jgi:hypothetical protein